MRLIVHDKPNDRETWAPHVVEGWYIGPVMHHYICYKVWIKVTRAEWIPDTIDWFPSSLAVPISSSTDRIMSAAHDLTRVLVNAYPASPLVHIADANRLGIHQLSDIFTFSQMKQCQRLPYIHHQDFQQQDQYCQSLYYVHIMASLYSPIIHIQLQDCK